MSSLVHIAEALFVGVCIFGMSYAVVWCLFDVVVRERDTPVPLRLLWAIVILGFNVFGAILYVYAGPGHARWTLWEVSKPAKSKA